jgi:hypothetical protein
LTPQQLAPLVEVTDLRLQNNTGGLRQPLSIHHLVGEVHDLQSCRWRLTRGLAQLRVPYFGSSICGFPDFTKSVLSTNFWLG